MFNILSLWETFLYCSSLLYDVAYGTESIHPSQRKEFSDLELMYETAIKERFENVEAPPLEAPAHVVEKRTVPKEKKEVTLKKTKRPKKKAQKAKKAVGN